MSQHWLTGKIGENSVEILIGWDEPLKHFFLTIEPYAETPIYSNLHEAPNIGFSHTLADYQDVLERFGVSGISLDPSDPSGLYHELMNDKTIGKMA